MNDILFVVLFLKNIGFVVVNDVKKERIKVLVVNIYRLGEFCVSVVIIYIVIICFICMVMEKKGVKNLERFFFIIS